MRFLIIVSDSPWGTSASTAAWRCARALVAAGEVLDAVFFNGDGVYNALPGAMADGGKPGPQASWAALAGASGARLLVCSAAAGRRIDSPTQAALPAPFSVVGLAALLERMDACDRVVAF